MEYFYLKMVWYNDHFINTVYTDGLQAPEKQ